jgi:organic radical activating enzyme
MNNLAANIVELFSSIQGEGPFVGVRQVFLRFSGCNLDCTYCDTKYPVVPEHALLESTPGRRDFVQLPNPVTLPPIISILKRWQGEWPGIHHSLSLTGGEPLIHCDILHEWLPQLKDILPIYLETNGILHGALRLLLSYFDFISMDIKLSSTSGAQTMWQDHHLFLGIAREKNVLVKIVISNATEKEEIERAGKLIGSVDRNIPLVLQPMTYPEGALGINPQKLLVLQETACSILSNVRVIPQTHKFSGLL